MKAVKDFRWVMTFGVFIVLIVGLSMVSDVGREREHFRREAFASVAASVAGESTLAGPWMTRACTETVIEVINHVTVEAGVKVEKRETKRSTRDFQLILLPDDMDVNAQSAIESKYRGIYKVNVFGAGVKATVKWPATDALEVPKSTQPNATTQCDPVRIQFASSDQRALRAATLVHAGRAIEMKAGVTAPSKENGLSGELAEAVWRSSEPSATEINLTLIGTEALAIAPLAKQTRIKLQSNWPHPSFTGEFSPSTQQVSAEGFSAQWTLSALSSNARNLMSDSNKKAETLPKLRVAFIDPVNAASMSLRATKYGVLFVFLTFLGVVAAQVMRRLDIHPVQYLMTGAALVVFFLLLISLSEHIAFVSAYSLAALGCCTLLGGYAMAMFRSKSQGAGFGAIMLLMFGLLFLVLQSEQHALLAGSLTVFAALALTMILTRRVDWFAVFRRASGSGHASAATVASAPFEASRTNEDAVDRSDTAPSQGERTNT